MLYFISGWGKPSNPSPLILSAVSQGASRNIWLGNLDDSMTELTLLNELSQFGPIDNIRLMQDKRIAFVHLCSIASAIQAVNYISSSTEWENIRVYYGKDRCTQPPVCSPTDNFGYVSSNQIYPSITQMYSPGSNFSLGADIHCTPQIPNRTIYIGGIHVDATAKDLCDVIFY